MTEERIYRRIVVTWLILSVLTILLLSSCRTQYVPTEAIKTEYRVRDSIRHDSVYQRDSVYIIDRGDTVYKYKDRYLYKYLYLNRTDTVIKTDSIQVPYPVEKQLTRWQKIKIELGGWSFGIIISFALVIVGWLILKRMRK